MLTLTVSDHRHDMISAGSDYRRRRRRRQKKRPIDPTRTTTMGGGHVKEHKEGREAKIERIGGGGGGKTDTKPITTTRIHGGWREGGRTR